MDSAYFPNSPYIIKFGVDLLTPNIHVYLQNLRCSCSVVSKWLNPQISHPYNKIGFIILSNKSNWQSIDKRNYLHFLNTANIVFDAWLIKSFLTFVNEPDLLKTSPSYFTSVTTSISLLLHIKQNVLLLKLPLEKPQSLSWIHLP